MVDNFTSATKSFTELAKSDNKTQSKEKTFVDLATSEPTKTTSTQQSKEPSFTDLAQTSVRVSKRKKKPLSQAQPTFQELAERDISPIAPEPSAPVVKRFSSDAQTRAGPTFEELAKEPSKVVIDEMESVQRIEQKFPTTGTLRESKGDPRVQSFVGGFQRGFTFQPDPFGREQRSLGAFELGGVTAGQVAGIAAFGQVGGQALRGGAAGLKAVNVAERALLQFAPTGTRTLAAIGIAGLEGEAIRRGVEAVGEQTRLSKEEREFIKQQETQQLIGETFQSIRREQGLTQNLLSEVSLLTIPETKFIDKAMDIAESRGQELSKQEIKALKDARKNIGQAELAASLNLARSIEATTGGRVAEAAQKAAGESFAKRFGAVGLQTAKGGIAEGAVEVFAGQQSARDPRGFLPEKGTPMEFVTGQKSLGRGADIAFGAVGGGLSAGLLGGIIGAGSKGLAKTKKERVASSVVNVFANIADPFEKAGDILAEPVFARVPTFAFVPGFGGLGDTLVGPKSVFNTLSVKQTQVPVVSKTKAGGTRVSTQLGFAPNIVSAFSPTNLFTPVGPFTPTFAQTTGTPIQSPSPSQTELPFPIGPTPTPTQTPTKTVVNTITPTPTETQTQVPVPTTTTSTSVPIIVPTVTPLAAFPLPGPLQFGLPGGRGGKRRKGQVGFFNELEAAFGSFYNQPRANRR